MGLESIANESASMILSNPPYIPTGVIQSLQPEVRDFEPRLALDGGADGLDIIRSLIADSPRVLESGGWFAVEVGIGQADNVRKLMRQAGLLNVDCRKDLAAIDRVLLGRKP
jgi:release factor glutamine methyltransferase